ncbi:MAG: GT4 family glycosyltransferase PelF [Acidobacteriia bacterium]|nr:GT4 family glycosyltransferase PelF [Terriglobia bacterium]
MSSGSQLDAVKECRLGEAEETLKPARISVCHVASGDRWAGAEVQVATLLKALAARKEFKLSAILLNAGRLAAEIEGCGIPVGIIPESRTGFLSILRQAERIVEGQGLQILHSHRYKENLLAAWLARKCGVPVLVRTQHGLPEPFHGFRNIKQRFLQRLDTFVARRATDCVISVSEEMRRRLTQEIPQEKVRTIPNSISLECVRSEFSAQEAKRQLGIPEDAPVIGIVGRLDRIKRVDLFLAAGREIVRQLPPTRFVIAGEGREEVELRKLARDLGLENQALFLGHRDNIHDVLRSFDILVLCSDHEGLPTVLLEALHLGVPVIARRVGGIGEVIENRRTGVLLDSDRASALAEACLQLLRDNDLRRNLQVAGRLRVSEQYDSGKAAANIAALYHSLCGVR